MASSGKTTRSQPAASACSQRVEDALDVAVEVADDGVELAERDAQAGHGAAYGVPCAGTEPPVRQRRAGTGHTGGRAHAPTLDDADRAVGRARRARATRVERLAADARSAGRTERLAADPGWPPRSSPVTGGQPRPHPPRRDRPGRRSTCSPTSTDRPSPTADDARRAPPLEASSSTCASRPATCSASTTSTVTVAAISALAADVLAGVRPRPGSAPTTPWPSIGMGKLGGGELNYASDIDVMFVGDGDPAALERCGPRGSWTSPGRCFRVDANLRPEGRDGPLVRTRRRRTRRTGTGGPSRGSSRRC